MQNLRIENLYLCVKQGKDEMMKPKYKIIADLIQKDIINDFYHNTKKLPTEEELVIQYCVSRTTVRKAIDMLAKHGFITPIQGSGYFIRNIAKQGYINIEVFKGLTADVPSNDVTSELLDFYQLSADRELSEKMKCEIGTPLYFVKRLRYIERRKSIIEFSYFNKKIIPYLNEEIIRKSIYQFIEQDLELEIGYVDRVIEARYLTPEESIILELKLEAPALVSTNFAQLKTGQIFDYSIDVHNYQNTKFLKLSNYF